MRDFGEYYVLIFRDSGNFSQIICQKDLLTNGTNDSQVPQSDVCYIGFWTDKGNADQKTLELLSKLKNKKIFLFGTAGFGGSDAYFEKIPVRRSVK